jgi:hypothetical protein
VQRSSTIDCRAYLIFIIHGMYLGSSLHTRLAGWLAAGCWFVATGRSAYDLEGNGGLPSRVYFDAEVDTRSFWEHYMPVFHDWCGE